MNIEIERIKQTGKSTKVKIFHGNNFEKKSEKNVDVQTFLSWEELKNKIYARMVEHVGNRLYWVQWAHKIAEIVNRHTNHIFEIISVEGEPRRAFEKFLSGLKENLGTSVDEKDAVICSHNIWSRVLFLRQFLKIILSQK